MLTHCCPHDPYDAPVASSDFPIVDVTDWPVASLEAAGSDPKVWLISPTRGKALFKPNRANLTGGQGEDWAEKFVSELALLLGIPSAQIDLAKRATTSGANCFSKIRAACRHS